jgi:DNA-binding beta-propeller fold protein YncE
MLNRSRFSYLASALFAAIGLTVLAISIVDQPVNAKADTVKAPIFEVDPLWPKPMPNHWLLGMAIGVWVDEKDHVWIIHRGAATLNANELALTKNVGECCASAPPVLEFDPSGRLVQAWGGPGPGYEWPDSNHGIHIDHKGNVWIGGNGENDAHILKFTRDGKFLMQMGKHKGNKGINDTENFGRVAKIWVDPKTNEAYVADGYKNKRVAVLDADTGVMKRYWGAYGNKPDDGDLGKYDPSAAPPKQFRNPVHCVERSNDGMVYVCDRQANRVQVFKPDGTFIKEAHFARQTLASGSAWDLAFSKDPQQRFIFLADGTNEKIRVIVRETMMEITNFGDGGRQPGQFFGVHSIATDSKGNIYITETYEGKRLQKFVYKGMGDVASSQGTVWPKR